MHSPIVLLRKHSAESIKAIAVKCCQVYMYDLIFKSQRIIAQLQQIKNTQQDFLINKIWVYADFFLTLFTHLLTLLTNYRFEMGRGGTDPPPGSATDSEKDSYCSHPTFYQVRKRVCMPDIITINADLVTFT